jgi:hypothetical protein
MHLMHLGASFSASNPSSRVFYPLFLTSPFAPVRRRVDWDRLSFPRHVRHQRAQINGDYGASYRSRLRLDTITIIFKYNSI